jgi:pimeloyl-ACP methyl ester carboxylesterase
MAYWDEHAEGRPVAVFLEGTGCDARDWDSVCASLPAGLRVVRLDFPGHGQSDAPRTPITFDSLADDVLALIHELALERAVLVGHSLGGMVAMAVAARCTQVAGLVLLEGWTNSKAFRAFGVEDRNYGELDADAIRRIKNKANETVRHFPAEDWQRFRESVAASDAFAYLSRAQIPIAEVYGERGRTPETEKQLHIPDNPCISVHWIPGAGHYLPHEKPREVAALCARVAAAST